MSELLFRVVILGIVTQSVIIGYLLCQLRHRGKDYGSWADIPNYPPSDWVEKRRDAYDPHLLRGRQAHGNGW